MQYYLKSLSGWLRPAFSCLLLLASGFALAEGAEEKSVIIIQEEDDGPIPEVEVYDRMLPIWGKEAVARGHEIPKPFGFSVVYMDISQPLIIENIGFSGFNNIGPIPVNSDQLHVDANVATQEAKNITFRADMWLLPFLNVYAVLGKTDGSSTARINGVSYDLQCGSGWSLAEIACRGSQAVVDGALGDVSDFNFDLNYEGGTYGAGATIAGGVGNWFAMTDMNYTYTSLNILDGKITTFVMSPRVGYRFKVGSSTEGRIWLGAMYQDVQQNFTGSVSNLEALPPAVSELFPDGKFHISQRLVERWNGTAGAMFEINRTFELLFEAGFGDRKSLMGSLGYRF